MPSSAHFKALARRFGPRLSVRVVAAAALIASFAQACNLTSQQQDKLAQNHPTIEPLANGATKVDSKMALTEQPGKPAGLNSGSDRRHQIADDSAKLLKLAGDLKAEVDKSSKDTLSIGVIRKADEIEKLARAVKEKMKLSIGGN